MYLIISSAIFTGALSYSLIKYFKIKSLDKKEIKIDKKEMNKGVVIGGTIFGIGWAITGACPGPIFAQIGTGEWAAVAKSKLPH